MNTSNSGTTRQLIERCPTSLLGDRFGGSSFLLLWALLSLASSLALSQGTPLVNLLESGDPTPEGGVFEVGNTGFFPHWEFDAEDQRLTFLQREGRFRNETAIYLLEDNRYTRLVGPSTPVPNGTGTFTRLSLPVFLRDGVAFRGEDRVLGSGFYLARSSGVEALADGPAFGKGFDDEAYPLMESHGDRLIFKDNGALYLEELGTITELAREGGVAPDGTARYQTLVAGDISGEMIAFSATTSAGWGVFSWRNGQVESLASHDSHPAVGLPKNIRGAWPNHVSVHGSRVGFTLIGHQRLAGAYIWEEGTITRILGPADIDPVTGRNFLNVPHIFLSAHNTWLYASSTYRCVSSPYFNCGGALAVFVNRMEGTLYSMSGHQLVPILSFDDVLDGRRVFHLFPVMTEERVVVLASEKVGYGNSGFYQVNYASLPATVPALSPLAMVLLVVGILIVALRKMS